MTDQDDQVAAELAGLAAGDGGGADAPFCPTVDWWAMTPAARVEALDELRVFVARLVVAYGSRAGSIPRCWERHEGAVRILDALYRSYLIAIHPAQVGEALMGWHHNLIEARDELRALFAAEGCTDDYHNMIPAPAWAREIAENGKDSQAWTEAHEAAIQDYRRALGAGGARD